MDKVLYIVGMGPGREEQMTVDALNALDESEVIIGYHVYLDLLTERYQAKEKLSTPMKKEIERCIMAFEKASEGKIVSLICSGDAGVYGMASPILELSNKYKDVLVKIIPGVTACISGASILGAPINHDFCVISLSDLLTPWQVIEKRIIGAALGDFVIAIYNPSSIKRHDYLQKACDILLSHGVSENRACGYVENIGREGTISKCLTLKELRNTKVNMFTTVFIGNSNSYIDNNKLITPRGYHL